MTTQDDTADSKHHLRDYLEELLSVLKSIFCWTPLPPHSTDVEPGTQDVSGTAPPEELHNEDDLKPLLNGETTTETQLPQPDEPPSPTSLPGPSLFNTDSIAVREADDLLLKDLNIPSKWDLTASVEVEQGLFPVCSLFFLTWPGFSFDGDASVEKKPVALKWFEEYQRVLHEAESRQLLRAKFERWLDLKHPNILPFLGIMRKKPGIPAPLSMVSPWMDHRDLLRYLQKNPDADRLRLLLGVAKGLEYLHAQDPPVLHGDLRSSNVLINDEGESLLCDYDIIDLLEDHVGDTTSSLHWARWRAPECNDPSLGPRFGRTTSADVFSFGMLCYEVLSGKPPGFPRHNAPAAMMRMVSGDRPEILPAWRLDEVGRILCGILEECWRQDPTSRPSASLVVQQLGQTRLVPP